MSKLDLLYMGTNNRQLRVLDLKKLLATIPDSSLLYFMCVGRRMETWEIKINHLKPTRLMQEGEPGYIQHLVNETYDTSKPDEVTISFDIGNVLERIKSRD